MDVQTNETAAKSDQQKADADRVAAARKAKFLKVETWVDKHEQLLAVSAGVLMLAVIGFAFYHFFT